MVIFDDVARSGDEGAGYTEPHFPYLNRTGRVDLARVRALIEDWFGRYPRAHQAELRARLRSSNNETFDGAFFELYLHELLRRLGYELDVHPALGPDRGARPDFLARRGGEDRFYLEGRVARDESASKTAAQARVNEAYEALNRMESPDFFLSLEDHGSPATPVPKRFRVEVERFLRAQDYSRCVHLFRDGGFGALSRRSVRAPWLEGDLLADPEEGICEGRAWVEPDRYDRTGRGVPTGQRHRVANCCPTQGR